MPHSSRSNANHRAYRDLGAILTERAACAGDRVYVVEADAPERRLTFAELDALTCRLGHVLADRGVKPGDRVSILSGNRWELVVLFFGVQRHGAAVNPINVEVNGKNAARMLHDVEPRLAILDAAVPATLRDAARAARFPTMDLDEVFAALPGYPATSVDGGAASPRDIAIIDYTSGTTATPKGVCISHEAFFYMGRSMVERLGLGATDRVLEYRALSWASPQCLSLAPTLQAGAGLVLAPAFSRRRFFPWIRRHDVTIAAGVPTVLAMLLERPVPVTRRDVPSLKCVTSSAAPLSLDQQAAFERRYGVPILQGCGMTEAGFMALNPPGAPRPGSIGPAVPYLHARFVDETGRVCPPGRLGELVIGGPQMASAYLTDRGTLVPLPADGFRTGDLGHADPDGYLYLTGRRKDLIIRGGVNIAPMEITTVLLAHPAVAEAVTLGVPDLVYGEAIASFVTLRPGQEASPSGLLAHCRTRLSDFKCPGRVLVLDAIPTTGRGKLDRERLCALWDGSAGP
ncbi:MAG: class I adenylate-forming enzyme family protein [Candidatus Rokuibacteriota bacterium]